jgi:hypothetical protein
MITNRRGYHTSRFINLWPYLGLGSVFFILVALFISPVFSKTLLNGIKVVEVEESVVLKKLTLIPAPFGALRVNANAILPDNHWVVYDISLVDEQGNILVSAVKEAWQESGVWREGGESGTWSERDLKASLDIKGQEKQKVKLVLTVLGFGKGNTELDNSVPFDVVVKNGVIDTRPLWPGFIGSSVLGFLSLIAIPPSGRKVINKTVLDSDPTGRGTVGGKNNLVRVDVDVEADETAPDCLTIKLTINDAYGEQIYQTYREIAMYSIIKDGRKTGAKGGYFQGFFIIEPEGSYGFHVDVTPDASVDRTTLKVQNGTRTREAVLVTHLTVN